MFDRETLSIEEWEQTREFKRATKLQAPALLVWAESGGDIFLAFNSTHSAPSSETARKGAYGLFASKTMVDAMNRFLQKDEKEILIDELDKVLRSKKVNPSKLRGLELKAELMFGVDLQSLGRSLAAIKKVGAKAAKEPEAISEFSKMATYKVGQKAQYQGRLIVITGINELSRATDYELAEVPVEVR
jgi:hypothetical protein